MMSGICLYLYLPVESRLYGDHRHIKLGHLLAQGVRKGDTRFLGHGVGSKGWKREATCTQIIYLLLLD